MASIDDEDELRATRILNGTDKKCKKMNIEEAIEYLKNYKYDNEVRQAIEILLTAYEKEKEKNKNLQQIIITNKKLYNRETKRLGNIISELLEE